MVVRAAGVGLDGRHARGRRGRRLAEDAFHDPPPRTTGEVVVPFAVTLSTLAWVNRPPRGLSAGSGTRRMRHAFHGR